MSGGFPWELVLLLVALAVIFCFSIFTAIEALDEARKHNNDSRFRFFEQVLDWCALLAILAVMGLAIVIVKWVISLW